MGTQDYTAFEKSRVSGLGKVESMYLVRLARDRSETGRKAFAEALSDLFLADGVELTRQERSLIYDILHRIIHDIETAMRAEVSRHLAELLDAPRDLAQVLANDTIEVAYPILTLSSVLLDDDLIEIARNRTFEHQMAITARPDVSEDVSDALVELGDERVITALLKNPNAHITSATLEYLVEESRRLNGLQEPILRRADLPRELAGRMVMWVSAALRQYILDNFKVDAGNVDDALEVSALDMIRSAGPSDSDKSRKLARTLQGAGENTPQLLIGALRDGEIRLFVSLFEQMTRLSEGLIMDILLEPAGEGLAIACKAHGIDKDDFATIFGIVRRPRVGSERELKREVGMILTLFDRISIDSAKQVVRNWRRNVSYLEAVRDVEIS